MARCMGESDSTIPVKELANSINTAAEQGLVADTKNLANDPKYAEAKEKLKEWLPKANAKHFRPDALDHR